MGWNFSFLFESKNLDISVLRDATSNPRTNLFNFYAGTGTDFLQCPYFLLADLKPTGVFICVDIKYKENLNIFVYC